jgi:hypothetical protein
MTSAHLLADKLGKRHWSNAIPALRAGSSDSAPFKPSFGLSGVVQAPIENAILQLVARFLCVGSPPGAPHLPGSGRCGPRLRITQQTKQLWNSPLILRKLLAMNRLTVIVLASIFVLALAVQSIVAKQDSSSDALVVAAGTEIKTSVTLPQQEMRTPYSITGKVVTPVRVGFATAIPALSVANIKITPTYVYSDEGTRRHHRQLVNLMQLTSIVVGGVVYEVSTAEVSPISRTPGLDSEISFVLQQPLRLAPRQQ